MTSDENDGQKLCSLLNLLLVAFILMPGISSLAVNATWNGTTSASWATSSNWSDSPAPGTGNTATFSTAGNGNTTIDLGTGVTVGGILFDQSSAAAYTLGSGGVNAQTLTLDNGGAISMYSDTGSDELVNAKLILGSATAGAATNTLNAWAYLAMPTKSLSFAGDIIGGTGGGAKTLTLSSTINGSGGKMLISGAIRDGGAASVSVVKSSGGVVTLSGTNSYSGSTTINAGVLVIAATTSLPGWDSDGRYFVAGGGTLAVGNGVSDRELATILATTNFAAGARVGFDTSAGDRTYTNLLADSALGALGLTKVGSNALTLSGMHTFNGATTVSGGTLILNGISGTSAITVAANGTLAGSGLLNGAVIVLAGGTLAPGGSTLDSLTVSNAVALAAGSITRMEISKTLLTNDRLSVSGGLNYGGTLSVTNRGGTLAVGDSFKLFGASVYTNDFSAMNLPSLPVGLTWAWSASNGNLSVISAGRVGPLIGNVTLSQGRVGLSGSNGTSYATYSILTSTNLALALTNWVPLLTNTFDASGHFVESIPITDTVAARFFLLAVSGSPVGEDFSSFIRGGWCAHVNQREADGFVYKENGMARDPFQSLKDQGWNYAGVEMFCGTNWSDINVCLGHARRARIAGLKIALNIFYADDYAHGIPAGWPTNYADLQGKVYEYTVAVLRLFAASGLTPDMVKVGNEVNHVGGFLLPVGKYDTANFYGLLKAGCQAVKDFNPAIQTMIHSAGGDNHMISACIKAGVPFDIYAVSYYPTWGAYIADLPSDLNSWSTLGKRIMLIETAKAWTTHNFDARTNELATETGYANNPVSAFAWHHDLTAGVAANSLGVGVFTWPTAYVATPHNSSRWDNAAFWDSATGNCVSIGAAGIGGINPVVSLYSCASSKYVTVDANGNLVASATSVGTNEQFYLAGQSAGYVALMSRRTGGFVTASSTQVTAGASSVADAQKWRPEDHAAGYESGNVAVALLSKALATHLDSTSANNWKVACTQNDTNGTARKFWVRPVPGAF